MKKVLVCLGFTFLTSTLFAQNKVGKASTTKSTVKPDNTALIKRKAEAWFKTEYVPSNFKDKYSYKPLKTTVVPVSLQKQLEEDTLLLGLENLRYEADSTKGHYEWYKSNARDALKNSQNDSTSPYYSKYRTYLGFIQVEKQRLEASRIRLDKKLNSIAEAKQRLARLTEAEKKTVGYYLIFHDCHANNSYGGQVLGVYSFKYDAARNMGYDVIKLND